MLPVNARSAAQGLDENLLSCLVMCARNYKQRRHDNDEFGGIHYFQIAHRIMPRRAMLSEAVDNRQPKNLFRSRIAC
jgi:hypothetical protein